MSRQALRAPPAMPGPRPDPEPDPVLAGVVTASVETGASPEPARRERVHARYETSAPPTVDQVITRTPGDEYRAAAARP
ncbi:hypothetical protein DFJ69_6183 [Thermomonospora umbrina]|uniref:Uncharacterized protein n=1 Tax=Thermomonospora umbrina TaxID=111806 RepID=A0A3D9SXE5_9ACTN|nr:hypothetical protein DFJ69_6183 [Thermomonospora umbrina]